MYDKIEVGNCWYNLKSLVRCYQSHFTCGIVNDQKWLYFDDLLQTVREFPSLEAMQRHIPGGWFFALFELNGHSSCTKRIEMQVIKNLGGKPIETPSSTHFQTRSQRKEKLKKGVAPPQQELEKSVAGNNSMKNRTHYVPYQSQDAKNTENTPIIKNVETVQSLCSNSGCFELNNDNVQNIEFDPKHKTKNQELSLAKKKIWAAQTANQMPLITKQCKVPSHLAKQILLITKHVILQRKKEKIRLRNPI